MISRTPGRVRAANFGLRRSNFYLWITGACFHLCRQMEKALFWLTKCPRHETAERVWVLQWTLIAPQNQLWLQFQNTKENPTFWASYNEKRKGAATIAERKTFVRLPNCHAGCCIQNRESRLLPWGRNSIAIPIRRNCLLREKWDTFPATMGERTQEPLSKLRQWKHSRRIANRWSCFWENRTRNSVATLLERVCSSRMRYHATSNRRKNT